MCAIHGFCWRDDDASMERMLRAARHRGPDGKGTWGDERVTLGHNLLAIADKAEDSFQPWRLGSTVLTYNGEVYNYRELRAALKHPHSTDCDTEVLANGLCDEGPGFLRKVDGMFALAWYTDVRDELILARDSNGAKPLYYGFLNGKLAFSSEIRSLLSLGFDRRVCREAFKHYFYSGLVAGPLTMFEGIRRVLPGQVLKYRPDTGLEELFNLNDAPVPVFRGDARQLPELIRDRLGRAVDLTLTGRRDIGIFLSGGLDSASVLREAARNNSREIRTFTTRFELPHKKCNHNEDADVARQLSKMFGSRHREVLVTAQNWIDDFGAAVEALEEPRQGKSYAAYYATNRRAAEAGVTVTLSGDGGDELLVGYKHQRNTPFLNKLAALRSGHRELKNPALALTLEEQGAYLDSWLPRGGLTGDAVNDFMYTECLHTLSEDFLIRNDKLGSAFSMEARFPMMCKVFRDFVRGVPSKHKTALVIQPGGWDLNNKCLLRAGYASRLPAIVTKKGKTGWRAPTDDWLIGRASLRAPDKSPVREFVRATLADPEIRELFELTDDDVENRYLNNRDFDAGNKDSGKAAVGVGLRSQKELFAVLMFAVWFRRFDMRLW